jgi:hypothetical protein
VDVLLAYEDFVTVVFQELKFLGVCSATNTFLHACVCVHMCAHLLGVCFSIRTDCGL